MVGLEGKLFKGREERKHKDELTQNTEMRCKNSIRDLGKGRGDEDAAEGWDSEVFFSSPVGGSESLFFSPWWWRAEGSRKVGNMGECCPGVVTSPGPTCYKLQ